MTVPAALAPYRQFILYGNDKVPRSPHTGEVCDPHDPRHHVDGPTATAAVTRFNAAGVGLVFTANDPLFFLDIDHCLTETGWSPLAVDLCRQFAGCYVEVSRSGTGLHIIGTTAPVTHGCRNKQHGLELYTSGRYCALTGRGANGNPLQPADLSGLITTYFQHGANDIGRSAEWTDAPRPEWSGPADDTELITRMLNSRPSAAAAFGARATVQELWAADADALGRCYPDSRPEGFDHSSADAALCSHLAFWTGCDCDRMDRLFRQSALMRDKWDEQRGDKLYSEKTILHAVGHCQQVYGTRATDRDTTPPGEPEPADPLTGLRAGYQLIPVSSQVEYFAGCVYVRSEDAILVPDGALLKPSPFKAMYGGYQFCLDNANEKVTKSAWEAFTESQGYHFPKAHETCFRPECPPAAIIPEEGRTLVNTYVPIETPRVAGDASRFTDFVARLIPDPNDRAILLAYMAALVRYPGRKFQWAPLLQGVEGNGKTLLITALSRAVGNRYTHLPNSEDLANKFNAWIIGKLFIGIEEVYVADRRELVNVLKPLITNKRLDIQGKGTNQATGDNRANFFMCSNHKDAVQVVESSRRYCVFYTAQQDIQDIQRDGMGGDYFPSLYDWLDGGGWAVVNDYLRNYQIPDELNPATHCHRAPVTSSTAEAVRVSMGGIEQEIMEAIEEGRPGFAGGWVSSLALDLLLAQGRQTAKIPRNRRRDVMKTLGYDYHPGLRDGRVNNTIMDSGTAGKPRLYIRHGHLAAQLTSAPEIIRHYQDAQSGAVSVAAAVFAGHTAQGVHQP
jgi:hypothetical protein